MPHYLPSSSQPERDTAPDSIVASPPGAEMADLRVFWGPEICRLEYLVHLLDTGRIVDERQGGRS
jgi:hypothetical protein